MNVVSGWTPINVNTHKKQHNKIVDHTSITPASQYADFLCPDKDQADKKHISVKQSASP